MALQFPDIDPVIISIGPIAIRWYAVAYIVGILAAWYYIIRVNKKVLNFAPEDKLEDLVIWGIVGIILGGRLGYVFFYNPAYFLSHPNEIFMIWQGGMSFHGGLLGVIISMYLFSWHYKVPFLRMMDVLSCIAPLGFLCGRIANFINGELHGRPTDVPWGMVFPHVDGLARHPSQIYQALLEGLLLLIIMNGIFFFTKARNYVGKLSGIFLIGYGIFRTIAEYFREPDIHIGFIASHFTMGQLLSIPMVLLGILLVVFSRKNKVEEKNET